MAYRKANCTCTTPNWWRSHCAAAHLLMRHAHWSFPSSVPEICTTAPAWHKSAHLPLFRVFPPLLGAPQALLKDFFHLHLQVFGLRGMLVVPYFEKALVSLSTLCCMASTVFYNELYMSANHSLKMVKNNFSVHSGLLQNYFTVHSGLLYITTPRQGFGCSCLNCHQASNSQQR